jgi:hypothetical protein
MADFVWDSFTPGNISLNIQYKDSAPCSGELTVKNCSLRAATVRYDTVIDGNKSTITLAPGTSMFDDVVFKVLDYPAVDFQQPVAIGGFAFALSNRFASTSHMRWVGADGYELISTGATGPQFAVLDAMESTPDPYVNGMCKVKFRDPTDYLLKQAREFMFRTAVGTASGNSSDIQTAIVQQRQSVGIYRSHYIFLGLAAGISLAAVLIVFATFHGYWRLGRSMTLSPVELAKAFNAPLLAFEDSNAEVNELVAAAGAKPVRYGLVQADASEDSSGEMKPVPNMQMGLVGRGHLEIADPSLVQPLSR